MNTSSSLIPLFYPSGFSPWSPSEPPPSGLLPPEPPPVLSLSAVTSSKTRLFAPPLVVALLSFTSRRVLATLKRMLTRSMFFTVQSLASSAYVLHVFGRHGAQCFNVLRDTGKVEDFGILGLAFQGVDHGGAAVPDFLVALCAHY